MFKTLFGDRWTIFLFITAIALRLLSLNEAWIERYYTYGFYPRLSAAFRAILGWIPFSVGDLLYILAFLWLVRKTWKLLVLLKQKRARSYLSWVLLRKYVKLSLLIYIVFSLCWGLNYFRQGVSAQLGLQVETYTVEDLFSLTVLLQQRLNSYAEKLDSVERLQYNSNHFLFQKGADAYAVAKEQYPFLAYRPAAIKPSLFTPVGHLFGFTGYFNPFTSEAQLKTSIPVFLKPFVVTHEIAHQVGYAKENEASFVAFLACKASGDLNFLYSVYFELYRDAIFACRLTPNKELTDQIRKNVHPRVRWDHRDLRLYLARSRNLVEPLISGVYDRYLRLNNQPKGKATYNEVIAYVMAYWKKFGEAAV